MRFSTHRRRCIPLVFVLLAPLSALAQSVTILGDNSAARECFFAAQLAVQMQTTSRSEVQTCSDALLGEILGLRDRAATFINRGILYVALEDYQSAVKDYAAAMRLYPEFGAIYVNRGNLYFLGEQYDTAIQEYDKALELGLKQESVAHLNRGMAYEKLGKFQQAEADYRQALALVPDWHVAKSKLERVLQKIN